MSKIGVDTIKDFASANTAQYLFGDSVPGNIWLNRTISFRYTDKSGKRSNRTVEPRRVDENGDGYVMLGWCHHRREPRTFLISKMEDICMAGLIRKSSKREKKMTKITKGNPAEFVVSAITEQIKIYGKLQQLAEISESTTYRTEFNDDALTLLVDIQNGLRNALNSAFDAGKDIGITHGEIQGKIHANS